MAQEKVALPFDLVTGRELPPSAQPGYYTGFSTLDQEKAWDGTTRKVVTERVTEIPSVRFFSPEQAMLLQTIIDRLIPQDDRIPGRKIPILPIIDQRLYTNALIGFRYEDMPSDREAYQLGLTAIAEMAQRRFGADFPDLTIHRRELILKSLHDSKPDPAHAVWQYMPVHRFWALLMEDCVDAYYAHPWAWDEIGFGGPAYPRGYMRFEYGQPEPWEVDEQRYEWNAPADSVSDLDYESVPPPYSSTGGHGGTH